MKFLTKGDNNQVDDRGLYAPGQFWLARKDVVGRARGFVPYVGIVTILMNDYPSSPSLPSPSLFHVAPNFQSSSSSSWEFSGLSC